MRIFISYRRRDNPYLPYDLARHLQSVFGSENVFLDVSGIRPGSDFLLRIRSSLERVDVVLAVIGNAWDSPSDRHRIDYVNHELLEARRLGKRVIPVLHSGRPMPTAEELPEGMEWLATLNAVEFRGPRDLAADFENLSAMLLQLGRGGTR